MRCLKSAAALMVLVLGVVGCSGDAGASASGTPPPPIVTASASPSPVAKTPVAGEEQCTIVDAVYEGNVDRERFACTERSSDPRVEGTWESWVVTTETGGGLGWWAAELMMSNSLGTWRGTASGMTRGMPTAPWNIGEIIWTGEGGHAGLIYHELFAGSNGRLVTAGWIESSTP
jgi:hypothetical protein